jgi:hypothetical protein
MTSDAGRDISKKAIKKYFVELILLVPTWYEFQANAAIIGTSGTSMSSHRQK